MLDLSVTDEGYQSIDNVRYGAKSHQKLNLYRPEIGQQPYATVVFFYGGRWRSGSKNDYRFIAQALAENGIATVLPDYGLYPQYNFPDFMADAAKAVAWTYAHAKEYQLNKSQIYLMGHSAGAQIAAMLSLDRQYLARENIRTQQLAGLIGLAGPYDFYPFTDSDVKQVFASVKDKQQTQPIHYVGPHAPPMLLLSGLQDTTVRVKNSRHLAARQIAQGGKVQTRYYPKLAHVGILLSLAKSFRTMAPVLEDSVTFIRQPKR